MNIEFEFGYNEPLAIRRLTVHSFSALMFTDFPVEGPVISGIKANYKLKDLFNVSCSAKPSKPEPVLRWFINGDPAPQELVHENEFRSIIFHEYNDSHIRIPGDDGLLGTFSYLQFRVQSYHFINGMLKIRCTAIISEVYSKSREEVIIFGQKPYSTSSTTPLPSSPYFTGKTSLKDHNHWIKYNVIKFVS